MDQPTHARLIRGIRRWDFVALVLNSIIGAGIFGLPAKVFALSGSYCLIAYVACAVLVGLIMLCFAELGSRFERTGGPYLYARQAFGSVVGFEVGWLMWLARVTAFASLCNLFVDYLSYFWPAAASGVARWLVIVAVVAALMTVNLLGIRQAARVSNLFTLGKMIPLVGFAIAGLFFIDPSRYSPAVRPGYVGFSSTMLLLVFAFSGFEAAVIPAGEATEPRRHIPFALMVALAIIAVLYVLIQFVCIGTLPDLANSQRPLADAAGRFAGAAGASIISAAAMISVTGTLNGIMIASPRLLFAMAEDRLLPRVLSAVHPRFRTPHLAIAISALVMLALTLWGTFLSALTISTIIRLIAYAATCSAVPVLRSRSDAPPAAFAAPAGTAVAAAALVLCIWLLSSSTLREAALVTAASAAGMLLWAVFRLSYHLQR